MSAREECSLLRVIHLLFYFTETPHQQQQQEKGHRLGSPIKDARRGRKLMMLLTRELTRGQVHFNLEQRVWGGSGL
ncbi:hypothetical protein chiPu_0023703 [Chiloscyllium punctatum]|uniref:Uncharacterized protein n=1 Tax=Chiloscyllium punctatum TaxID=137246 RepID=A0A401TAG0_CHIPU|nr:hypothetical protein [Chiloscyllium punctatum]